MKTDAIQLEEERLKNVHTVNDYNMVHERHRIFPAVFEGRGHQNILDLSAGMGVVAKRIRDHYACNLVCNDICPKCIASLQELGVKTVSFDLDNDQQPYPFPNKSFDAIISLSTIEHLIHLNHFLEETRRILMDGGYLYISSPNYAAISYMSRFVWSGRTFHDPFSDTEQYEFYAHYRYFTYKTLLDFVGSFGFAPMKVYIGRPEGSSYFKRLKQQSKLKAFFFQMGVTFLCCTLPPRWASEPVICFRKAPGAYRKPIKVVL
jgi:ubiquinone/menaquinone biosynthesis C-methylase UbiE